MTEQVDSKTTDTEDRKDGAEVSVDNKDTSKDVAYDDDIADRYSYLTRTGRDMRNLLREFPLGASNLFDSFFGYDIPHVGGMRPLEVSEHDKDVVFSFNVAGVDKDDIKVGIDRGMLTVNAGNEHHAYSYSRSIDVDVMDVDHATAKYDNGILAITVPKVERPRKTITVE